MAILSMLLIAWALCLMVFVALVIYRSQLTRHEVDQIFLSENIDHVVEDEHDDIVRRVDRIDPFVKTAGGATAVLTLLMVGIYVTQLLRAAYFK
jgi:hypothetical protein